MSLAAAPVQMHRTLPPEERARADFYALLARLANAPPDDALLSMLRAAQPLPEAAQEPLRRAWQGLLDASSAVDADAVAEEYELLFVGVGKSRVSIYSGYYSGAGAVDHPRVRIQRDLAALGLARPERVPEPEDHFAGLLDVMRVLVAGAPGRDPAALAQQKKFYEMHLALPAPRFFAAVGAAPEANYYRHVAALGRAFMALEAESFDLE